MRHGACARVRGGVVVGFFWGGLFFGGLGVVEGILILPDGFIMLWQPASFNFFFFRLFCVEQIIGPLLRYYFSFKRFWVISTNLGDFRWLYVSFNKNLETTHHHLSLSPHFSSVPKINTSLPCRKRTWHKALKIGRILIGKDRDSNYPYLFSRLEKGVGRTSSFWNPWFGREGYDKPTMSSSLRWSVPPLGFGTRGHGGFHLL